LLAIKNKAYDLIALRKFSTKENIQEILEIAKSPLNGMIIDKDSGSIKTSDVHVDDDDNDDVSAPKESVKKPNAAKLNESEDDDDDDVKEVSANNREEAAFSNTDTSNNDDDSDDSDSNSEKNSSTKVSNYPFTYNETEVPLDCRGTHDKHDAGCQVCDHQKKCKVLQVEFSTKAEELGLDISSMMGSEIEKKLIKLLAEKPVAKTGKTGKTGKTAPVEAPVEGTKKRTLPF
jgi:cobalamin biosynthesis protein CobT